MANALKGEASFEHDGETLTLLYDAEALLTIEDELDLPLFELFGTLRQAEVSGAQVKIGTLATILRAGLARHHPGMTRAVAAEILMTNSDAVQPAIGEAMSRMMPQAGDAGAAHPRTPAAKTTTPAKPKRGAGRKS